MALEVCSCAPVKSAAGKAMLTGLGIAGVGTTRKRKSKRKVGATRKRATTRRRR